MTECCALCYCIVERMIIIMCVYVCMHVYILYIYIHIYKYLQLIKLKSNKLKLQRNILKIKMAKTLENSMYCIQYFWCNNCLIGIFINELDNY